MPIDVTCPGCHKRFKVSDKFAGQKGPCPSCKAEIRVPDKSESVVVHSPEETGPKDSKGKLVLKPISRTETKVSIPLIVGIVVGGVLVFGVAWFVGAQTESPPTVLLVAGAILLAPPLAVGGYSFLRNDELEPYRGVSLWIRALCCGLAYAALWGLYYGVKSYLFGDDRLEMFQMAFLIPPFVAAGTFAAYASLDLEVGSSIVHYGFYLLVTTALGLLVGAHIV